MKRFREVVIFLFISLLSCLAVFQDAMWGGSIVAPVDLAPALWKHYHHVDPHQGPIPKNHYIVDQLGYDLPLQYLMYHAWRSGEVPWWNPYTLGGRPLLADAHCNGTDPVRLAVYFTFPDFVLAYNWTLILHAIGIGGGFFVLLRGLGVRTWLAAACALAAQWAGGFVLYIGHPWVRGTFLYYPFLWLAWHRAFRAGKFSIAAAFLVAAIFYSGNLQSHAYLPLFATAIGAGYAGFDVQKWRSFFKAIIPGAVLGTLIAAPVLIPQLELYAQNTRKIGEASGWHWLEAGALFAGVHPWAAGTFRTISLGGVTGGLSFHLAVGGVVAVLAVYGWSRRRVLENARGPCAASGFLVLVYFLIVLTPLHHMLYLRAAGLGIIGLTLLAAFGCEALLRSEKSEIHWSRAIWMLAAIIAVGTTVLAYGVYPHFQEKVRAMLLARADTDGYGGASRELRNFQVLNFGNEVSLRNPECALNVCALALLAAGFARPGIARAALFCSAILVSLVPLLMFAERFIPKSKTVAWSRLKDGGPMQKAVFSQFRSGMRFEDRAPAQYQRIFPQEISALHRLHVSHGYAALQPAESSASANPSDSSEVPVPGSSQIASYAGIRRFGYRNQSAREIRIVEETLNRLRVTCASGPADFLIRTDTWYPGWRVNGLWAHSTPDATRVSPGISLETHEMDIVWEYRPSAFGITMACACLGFIGTGALAWISNATRRNLSHR